MIDVHKGWWVMYYFREQMSNVASGVAGLWGKFTDVAYKTCGSAAAAGAFVYSNFSRGATSIARSFSINARAAYEDSTKAITNRATSIVVAQTMQTIVSKLQKYLQDNPMWIPKQRESFLKILQKSVYNPYTQEVDYEALDEVIDILPEAVPQEVFDAICNALFSELPMGYVKRTWQGIAASAISQAYDFVKGRIGDMLSIGVSLGYFSSLKSIKQKYPKSSFVLSAAIGGVAKYLYHRPPIFVSQFMSSINSRIKRLWQNTYPYRVIKGEFSRENNLAAMRAMLRRGVYRLLNANQASSTREDFRQASSGSFTDDILKQVQYEEDEFQLITPRSSQSAEGTSTATDGSEPWDVEEEGYVLVDDAHTRKWRPSTGANGEPKNVSQNLQEARQQLFYHKAIVANAEREADWLRDKLQAALHGLHVAPPGSPESITFETFILALIEGIPAMIKDNMIGNSATEIENILRYIESVREVSIEVPSIEPNLWEEVKAAWSLERPETTALNHMFERFKNESTTSRCGNTEQTSVSVPHYPLKMNSIS